jgi:hypothetical protein
MDTPRTPADTSKSDNGTEPSTERVILGLTKELATMNVHLAHISITQPQIERRTRRQFWVNMLMVLFVFSAAYFGWTNRQIVNGIEDCLNANGQCYKESRVKAAEGQNRIIDAQRIQAEKNLKAVCELFDAHGLERPKECE